jgi:hypothetical protein
MSPLMLMTRHHLATDSMRALALLALAFVSALASPAIQAGPGGSRGGGGAHARSGYSHGSGHWAGGPYRPGYGAGYAHGYRGWGYGFPGYGYGYGYGLGVGLGLGYGAGWAWTLGSPWYWGWPAVAYGVPAYYPYGTLAPGYPALVLDEDLSYLQQPQAEVIAAQAPRSAASSWYYCTEPAGYYPYVQQCARPWIAVQPNAVPPAGSAPGAPAP